MPYNQEDIAELKLLSQFKLDTNQTGIKVHTDADDSLIAAAKSLFNKGLTTRDDGGYLTDLGQEAHQHLESLMNILKPA